MKKIFNLENAFCCALGGLVGAAVHEQFWHWKWLAVFIPMMMLHKLAKNYLAEDDDD